MGEENLAANKRDYDALVKKKARLVPVKQAALFGEATRLTAAARRFIVDKKLVTILGGGGGAGFVYIGTCSGCSRPASCPTT